MADTVGALSLPVAAPADPDAALLAATGDPLRRILGDFLQAAIRDGCQAAWATIGQHTNVCERVEVNDPTDNTFVTSKLPCLALFRDDREPLTPVQLADEIRYHQGKVVALWIPPNIVQKGRALREPFGRAVAAAVDTAIRRGRTPSYKATGDTDPLTATQGSLVEKYLSVVRPLCYGVSFSDFTVTIDMQQGDAKKYPALRIMFDLWEDVTLGFTAVAHTASATLTTNSSFVQTQTYPEPV